jgi:hypothetical protein
MICAAHYNQLQIVQYCIDNGAIDFMTAVVYAIKQSNFEIVRFFIPLLTNEQRNHLQRDFSQITHLFINNC